MICPCLCLTELSSFYTCSMIICEICVTLVSS
ncbi:Uncharacterised protein [Vibrio cholerae]|nr:Uncharacterised protein [Vibrio cholerae]